MEKKDNRCSCCICGKILGHFHFMEDGGGILNLRNDEEGMGPRIGKLFFCKMFFTETNLRLEKVEIDIKMWLCDMNGNRLKEILT